jgi:peptidyl-prolyl cis-trans isomerase SurA
MNQRLLAHSLAFLASFCALTTFTPLAVQAQTGDFIVAVVNSEPVTNSEIRNEAQRLSQQLTQQRRPQPERAELLRVVLERVITIKAQLQQARELGIRVEDVAVDQAEQNVARQNKMNLAELHRQLAIDGMTPTQFREQLRHQLTLTRLREREVDSRVRVSDLEVSQYLRDQQANSASGAVAQEVNIAQILIAVSESSTPEQVTALEAKAQSVLTRARAGEDFATLARELSSSPDRANGGQLGLRSADRLPPLFVDATRNLAVGGLSGVLRSGAGFHVLKVVEKRATGMTVTQTRARHILLRATPQMNEAAARDKLLDFKRRIQTGLADFATLARDNSQDGSAAQGGDLGWASPGQFVPEFEEVMNALAPGQVSDPLISRFGVHLIQVSERRNTALSAKEQNEVIRNQLREKKLDDAYAVWAQDVRGRAYVEFRDAPQ